MYPDGQKKKKRQNRSLDDKNIELSETRRQNTDFNAVARKYLVRG